MRFLLLTTAAGLLTLSGAVHGLRTNRWENSRELAQAVAQLERIPDTLGDWQGQAPETLHPKHVEVAGLSGYLMRRFENRRTGAAVSVLLVCGRSGPIAVHTPDVCYRGAGFVPTGKMSKQSIEFGPDAPPADFWTAAFGKPNPAQPLYLRIYWSWRAQQDWCVPDNPRLTFAGQSVLYKLYVIHETSRESDPVEEKVPIQFLRTLLPELDQALFARS